jgi:hypothetical protein
MNRSRTGLEQAAHPQTTGCALPPPLRACAVHTGAAGRPVDPPTVPTARSGFLPSRFASPSPAPVPARNREAAGRNQVLDTIFGHHSNIGCIAVARLARAPRLHRLARYPKTAKRTPPPKLISAPEPSRSTDKTRAKQPHYHYRHVPGAIHPRIRWGSLAAGDPRVRNAWLTRHGSPAQSVRVCPPLSTGIPQQAMNRMLHLHRQPATGRLRTDKRPDRHAMNRSRTGREQVIQPQNRYPPAPPPRRGSDGRPNMTANRIGTGREQDMNRSSSHQLDAVPPARSSQPKHALRRRHQIPGPRTSSPSPSIGGGGQGAGGRSLIRRCRGPRDSPDPHHPCPSVKPRG